MSKKNAIFLIVAIILIVIMTVIIIVRNNEGKNKTIKSNGYEIEETKISKKEIDGLEITNIHIARAKEDTVLLATVKNTTKSETSRRSVRIKLLDKNKEVVGILDGYISPLKPGATTQLNIGVTEEYKDITDFEVE